ncbi:MAG: hypothetical protein ACOC80_14540 [Petrotogales bacterium]
MKNKDLRKVAKVILIVGVILCGIAQILPWGRLELEIFPKEIQENSPFDLSNIAININYFHWGGMQISPKISGVPEWFLTPTNFSGLSASPEIYGFAFGTLFLYFIIPLAIFSFITGLVAYRKVERKPSKNSLHAAISSIMAIIFFIIFIQLTLANNLSNIEESAGFSANYHWSLGFYLMICSSVLFFVAYAIIRRIYRRDASTKE